MRKCKCGSMIFYMETFCPECGRSTYTADSILSIKVKAKDLQLGDVIRPFENEYGFCTVKQIKDGWIELFRPYVHTADFSCTSGVICYIGFEDYKIEANDREVDLYSRVKLK